MPAEEYCSGYTATKQRRLLNIVTSHMEHNKTPTYHVIDMNAGDGYNIVDGSVQEGSTLQIMERLHKQSKKTHLMCFEPNIKYAGSLHTTLCKKYGITNDKHSWSVYPEKNIKAATRLSHFGKVNGIAYCDPVGKFQADAVGLLAKYFPNVDVLINCNCTIYKRVRAKKPDAEKLSDVLASIDKKHWFISEPVGIHQWSFIYGTNEPKTISSEQLDLLDITTIAGKARFDIVDNLRK